MFDWQQFLDANGVEYVASGPNVSRGEIAVACPFCGADDPSQHMAINLNGRGWVCRRNKREHRGKAAARLVRAILGCSPERAAQIVGSPTLAPSAELLAEVETLIMQPDDVAAPQLDIPDEFRTFGRSSVLGRPYVAYMRHRGFSLEFLRRRAREIRYCVSGPFSGRVVLLVHDANGDVVNWTGRAISRHAKLRYRTLPTDLDVARDTNVPAARVAIERTLLWHDWLMRPGRILYVNEGPMDALKLRSLKRRATCLFTSAPSHEQLAILHAMSAYYDRLVILLDRGADAASMQMAADLAAVGAEAWRLPDGVDDPGELDAETLAALEVCNL